MTIPADLLERKLDQHYDKYSRDDLIAIINTHKTALRTASDEIRVFREYYSASISAWDLVLDFIDDDESEEIHIRMQKADRAVIDLVSGGQDD